MIAGGKSFGTWTMTDILAKADLIPGLDHETRNRLDQDKATLARLQHSPLVWDVMYRYGEDMTKRQEQRTTEIMNLLKVDHYKRNLAMMAEVRQVKNLLQGKAADAPANAVDTYTLSLTVKEARDLPKMDMLHGIDSYCVVSIDDMQDEVYQTGVVLKNKNPVWDASFEWKTPADAQLLTVAIVDRDTITEDDLVNDVPVDCLFDERWSNHVGPV